MYNLSESQTTGFQKANHICFPLETIVCIGDPVIDCYHSIHVPGAAWNLYSNLKYFTKKIAPIFPYEKWVKYFYNSEYCISQTKAFECYSPFKGSIQAKTIVVSDHNKGFVNKQSFDLISDLTVVNTKYRTLNKSVLKKTKKKILIAEDYIEDFSFYDFVILFTQESQIRIYKKDLLLTSIRLPSVQPSNVVGMLDVMTATFAYVLHEQSEINDSCVVFAANLAIRFTSISTQTPYTCNLNFLKDKNVYY